MIHTSRAPFGILVFLCVCTLAGCLSESPVDTWVATAPAEGRYTEIDKNGTTVIPNGRLIRPIGQSVQVAPTRMALPSARTDQLQLRLIPVYAVFYFDHPRH